MEGEKRDDSENLHILGYLLDELMALQHAADLLVLILTISRTGNKIASVHGVGCLRKLITSQAKRVP